MRKRLSKNVVESLKPKSRQFLVWDDAQPGLVLRVEPTGKKRFYAYLRDHKGQVKRPKLADYDPEATDQIPDMRRMVRALLKEFEDAKRNEALELTGEAEVDLPIGTAFERALAQTKRGEGSRRDWLRDQTVFTEWLKKRFPACKTWRQLTRRMVTAYLADKLDGRSPNRRRLAMQPVIQTAGYMEREHQVPNVTGRLGLGNSIVRPPAKVYMRDLVAFLDWLRKHDPVLEVGAGLQGLAALQLQEALRLSWSKVDLKRGLIQIGGEDVQVKNDYRRRVIPIPSMLLEILKRAHARREDEKVQEIDGPVVPSPMGCFFSDGVDSWKNYTRRMRLAIKEFNPDLAWTPKDLRNCVLTLGALRGFSGDALEQYVGHAPRGITAKHYVPRLASVSAGERETIDEAMNHFRRLVVEHVEREIKDARKKRAGAKVRTVANG